MQQDHNAQQSSGQPEILFGMQRNYVKKMSSEVFNAPEVFRTDWEPGVKLKIDTNNRALPQQYSYEVTLDLSLTIMNKGKEAMFTCDISFATIYTLGGMGSGQMEHMLNVFCPNISFPYLREIVDTLLIKSSFPSLMLAPINFDAHYEEKKKRAEAAGGSPRQVSAGVSPDEVARLRAELADLKGKYQSNSNVSGKSSQSSAPSDNEKLKAELEALKAVRKGKK